MLTAYLFLKKISSLRYYSSQNPELKVVIGIYNLMTMKQEITTKEA